MYPAWIGVGPVLLSALRPPNGRWLRRWVVRVSRSAPSESRSRACCRWRVAIAANMPSLRSLPPTICEATTAMITPAKASRRYCSHNQSSSTADVVLGEPGRVDVEQLTLVPAAILGLQACSTEVREIADRRAVTRGLPVDHGDRHAAGCRPEQHVVEPVVTMGDGHRSVAAGQYPVRDQRHRTPRPTRRPRRSGTAGRSR